MSPDAFFEVLDDVDGVLVVRATPHAVGPWDPGALHGGPPSALLASAMQARHPTTERMPSRVSVEILRPVPLGVLQIRTEVRRGGRRVDLLHASMSTAGPAGADPTPVMTAAMWRIRTEDRPLGVGVEGAALDGPDGIAPSTGFFRPVGEGYVTSVETRFEVGDWATPGAATAWIRPRVALRDDQPLAPLDRVLLAADSGNGVSNRAGSAGLGLDAVFVNVDLGVHLVRLPEGEWVGLVAETTLTDHGIGLATTVLHDRLGPFGRGAQSLLVDPGSAG